MLVQPRSLLSIVGLRDGRPIRRVTEAIVPYPKPCGERGGLTSMRRSIFTLAVLAAALSAAAQEPQRPPKVPGWMTVSNPLLPAIDRLEPDVQLHALQLQRDAFIE